MPIINVKRTACNPMLVGVAIVQNNYRPGRLDQLRGVAVDEENNKT